MKQTSKQVDHLHAEGKAGQLSQFPGTVKRLRELRELGSCSRSLLCSSNMDGHMVNGLEVHFSPYFGAILSNMNPQWYGL